MAFPFRHLVFEGTGVRNPAYAGALTALEEAGALAAVEGAAGTSSGSIVALMVALRFTADDARRWMLDLDFARLLDGGLLGGLFRVVSRYGWHKAAYFRRRLGDMVAEKTGDPRTSFAQLRDRGFRALRVVATDVTTRTVRVFPDERTWDMPVADAVRISMSIPGLFVPPRLDGDLYVDGGLLLNYPIAVFDAPGRADAATLGFRVVREDAGDRAPIGSLHAFVRGVFGAILSSQESAADLRTSDRVRTVRLPDLGFQPTHFAMKDAQKRALMERGAAATRAFLESFRAGPASG